MQIRLRTLCLALGFTVVVVHGGGLIRRKREATRRALMFAALIEEFVRVHVDEPIPEVSEQTPVAS